MKVFNKKDVLSCVTAELAVVGTDGYFGDTLHDLIDAVNRNDIRTLIEVDDTTYCFECGGFLKLNYAFFLPADDVKDEEK